MNSRRFALTLAALTALAPAALHANTPPAPGSLPVNPAPAPFAPAPAPPAPPVEAPVAPAQLLTIVKTDGTTSDTPGLAVHDFGTLSIARTEPIQHDFAVRNDSATPVTLDHVQAACSCTAAVADGILPGEQIAAGKTITIHVSVDPGHLGPGPANKMVWVYLKGQPSPGATLQMTGILTPLLTFEPSLLDFGTVNAGQEKSLLLHVTGDPKLLSALTTPSLAPAIADLTFVREKEMHLDKDGKSTVDFHVVLGKHARIGMMQGTVSFTASPTENTRLASAYASLVGEVRGEINASPSTVAFGSVAGGKSAEQQIIINGAGKVLAKSTVRSASPYVTAKIVLTSKTLVSNVMGGSGTPPYASSSGTVNIVSNGGENANATLEVTLNDKAPSGVLQTEVVVTTPGGQQLALPVWAFIEGNAGQH
ncbi:hypothetical protein CCAX7_11900 [Capsulimonas corticalis]|uniref:Uncharacterized protein n=1 Tax=Capsulimonas corticalis TaxID=2219043 RepID=A0A402D4F5_9BACT|nr:DUF1573 domain-containing protein [Capsulimonas corticalis]BDI29139.1 hypothetical protein CCAX7_11900 [Capsulimonas corticalis]